MAEISVIVTTYNQENYLRTALDSILEQEISVPIEVLVGDDCSTDGTGAIVKEYAEKYPQIIIPYLREKNLGMSQNTMDLTMRGKGKYIAYLEGDDFWTDPQKLQKQYDFLEAHPEYVAVFGKSIIVDQNNVRNEAAEQYVNFFQKTEYTEKDFQEYMLPGQTCTAVYRREGFQKLMSMMQSQDLQIKYAPGDRLLVLSMLGLGKMWNSQEEVAAYRYLLDAGSNTWSSQNDYFSFKNEYAFLMGLKEMEQIAARVNLKLNFDERRKYEWAVIAEKKQQMNTTEVKSLRKVIYADCQDKFAFLQFLVKRKLG